MSPRKASELESKELPVHAILPATLIWPCFTVRIKDPWGAKCLQVVDSHGLKPSPDKLYLSRHKQPCFLTPKRRSCLGAQLVFLLRIWAELIWIIVSVGGFWVWWALKPLSWTFSLLAFVTRERKPLNRPHKLHQCVKHTSSTTNRSLNFTFLGTKTHGQE